MTKPDWINTYTNHDGNPTESAWALHKAEKKYYDVAYPHGDNLKLDAISLQVEYLERRIASGDADRALRNMKEMKAALKAKKAEYDEELNRTFPAIPNFAQNYRASTRLQSEKLAKEIAQAREAYLRDTHFRIP